MECWYFSRSDSYGKYGRFILIRKTWIFSIKYIRGLTNGCIFFLITWGDSWDDLTSIRTIFDIKNVLFHNSKEKRDIQWTIIPDEMNILKISLHNFFCRNQLYIQYKWYPFVIFIYASSAGNVRLWRFLTLYMYITHTI